MTDSKIIEQVKPIDSRRRRCCGIFDWLCKIISILLSKRPERGDPCVYIPDRIIHKPDPLIYSQFYLMKLNQPVTWDNPDVKILQGGVEQYTYDLSADTEYTIEITVRNASREKPANGTGVSVVWIEFGAGGQIRHAIDTLSTNVQVWPAVSKVTTKWRTPATPGHYCIEVEVTHPNDGNPANNRGWNNTQVKAAQSEVEVPVRIFNQMLDGITTTPVRQSRRSWRNLFLLWGGIGLALGVVAIFLLQERLRWWQVVFWPAAGYLAAFLLGYATVGAPPRGRKDPPRDPEQVPRNLVELTVDSYRFEDKTGKDADPDKMFAPRPPAWSARVEPATFHFNVNETYRDVHLLVDAPDQRGAPEVFNVNAKQGGAPVGGVTVTITRDEE